MTDEELYRLWYTASHNAGQPQCHYPQIDTLRTFYDMIHAAAQTA